MVVGLMEVKGRVALRVTNGLGQAMHVTRDKGVEEREEEECHPMLTTPVEGVANSVQATEVVSEGTGTKMRSET